MKTLISTLFALLVVSSPLGVRTVEASVPSEASPPEEATVEAPAEAPSEEVTLEGALVELTFKVGRVMRGRLVSIDLSLIHI